MSVSDSSCQLLDGTFATIASVTLRARLLLPPLLLLFAVALAACDGDSRPVAPTTQQPDGQRALEFIKQLAASPRVAGSPGAEAATSSVAAAFKSSGYDVELMPFDFETGSGIRATVVRFGETNVDATTLGGSGEKTVTGVAVYVGLADDIALAGKSLAGKVAIADRGVLDYGEKYDNVVAAGAVALIVINNEPGFTNGGLTKTVTQPAVIVGIGANGILRAAADSGRQVTVEVPVTPKMHGVNVIARKSPTATCTVLVGGHRDSVAGTGGANDNASGAAIVVEVARAFAINGLRNGPRDGLCFVTFDAEEPGLHGSRALAERMKREGNLPKLLLNLDDAGAGTIIELIGDAQASQRVSDISKTLTIPTVITSLPGNAGSDHLSFKAVGVPAVLIGGDDFSNIHTARDTVDKLNPTLIDQIGKLTYAAASQYLADIAAGR